MTKEFGKSFILYKAKNNNNGAASQWSIASQKDCVFLEMSNQIGRNDDNNAKFDWENKIIFKLGESDIGEILSVLTGCQDGVGPFDQSKNKHKGLFHSNKNGNAIMYFGNDQNNILRIYLSVKKDNSQSVVQHTISQGEARVLYILLCRAIEIMYRWD